MHPLTQIGTLIYSSQIPSTKFLINNQFIHSPGHKFYLGFSNSPRSSLSGSKYFTSISAAVNNTLMDKRRRKEAKTASKCSSEEVSSIEWEFINMTEQEEDMIYRMYKLVGDRWALIAGRIPGRKAEEIERFWLMRHSEGFANRRKELRRSNS